jgi:lipid-A-disaccharide synthase
VSDNAIGPARTLNVSSSQRALKVFVVAGEHSGDALGAKLMARLNMMARGQIRYFGVGGEGMQAEGLTSLFPLADVAVMGATAILAKLPQLIARVYRTVDAAVAAEPDVVVIIDSPEFTHQVAKRIRKRRPQVPIINYVSPTVWAWRPGRALKMRRYVDHVMALLPFEPAAHANLGGPPCTYVGHPLIERTEWMRTLDAAPLRARLGLNERQPIMVVLPGSRTSEIRQLMQPFGQALVRLGEQGIVPQVIVPVVDHVRALVVDGASHWPVAPHFVEADDDKFRAFKLASVALAASGTVTLELALAGTPMVVGYKVDGVARHMRFLVKVPSIILANLVLGENAFPEFIQEACTGDNLATALAPMFGETHAREQQQQALERISSRMVLANGVTPSEAAAKIVVHYADKGRSSVA